MKVELTLTVDNRVREKWDIKKDIDMPDFEELMSALERVGFFENTGEGK
jgi:hypothetical protein